MKAILTITQEFSSNFIQAYKSCEVWIRVSPCERQGFPRWGKYTCFRIN